MRIEDYGLFKNREIGIRFDQDMQVKNLLMVLKQ